MLEVFLLHYRVSNYGSIISGSLIDKHKISVEFCLTIYYIDFEILKPFYN